MFEQLANGNELVEVNDDLPDKLRARLNLSHHVTRTLFDVILRKCLAQAAGPSGK